LLRLLQCMERPIDEDRGGDHEAQANFNPGYFSRPRRLSTFTPLKTPKYSRVLDMLGRV
jgi:hypothetical protein